MESLSDIGQSALLEHEASFRLLFEEHPLPMWIVDEESLAFLAVNAAALRIYGYALAEFLEMTMDQIAELDISAEADHAENAASRSWRHTCKDGRTLLVESNWHEVSFRGKKAVLVLTFDRTEQRRIEEQNREQAKLLQGACDAILLRDLDLRVLFWNRGAERIYGWAAEEVMGRKVTELHVRERLPDAEKDLEEKGMWSGTLRHRHKDGHEVFVNSRWTLIRDDDGKPRAVLVINSDATETKKLEAQLLRAQRLDSIGTLASGIAHDLNNILSPILMSAGMLKKDLISPENAKLIKLIEGSAERGAGIVKQVLTFARGVEGERVLLQPKHLITELAKVMTQTFPRNIDIQTNLPTDLWTVLGDGTQLHQVLLNLCVNARDAMPVGGTITIKAENTEVDAHFASTNLDAQLGPHVALRVSDTGTGMTPEVMDKIFDPFFTTKEVGKGTGLGLATVIGIIKSHGGFLKLQSEVGVGTTFSVFLPANRQGAAANGQLAATPVVGGSGEIVLVVDDEATVRTALTRTLDSNGYRVFTAEDGTDGLALYFQRRDEINLVLTDISMAQMDGIAFVRALRKMDPNVRIVASSGHFQKESITVLESLGVKSFLEKPYSADKLLRILRTALEQPKAAKR